MPSPDERGAARSPKGQRTRERLLEAALRLFAVKGYEAVGTREISAAAGTNIASIAFHFGGKEGLYGAVIDRVAGDLARLHREALGEATAQSDAVGDGPGPRARRIVEKLVTALVASNRSQWMSLLLQREFITPTSLFEKIYAEAIAPTLTALSGLVGGGDSFDNKVLAFSLFIMASAFSRNKNTFLRFAGAAGYGPGDAAAIGSVVGAFAEHGLTSRP